MIKDTEVNRHDFHTGREINGQPHLWKTVYELLFSKRKGINQFLHPLLAKKELQIILSGAGSSAFIGEAAQGLVQKYTGCTTRAIATTDIITHPALFLQKDKPTLMVSFARSGNSPESLETVKIADSYCSEIYHLIITCNEEGDLMKFTKDNPENSLALLLPEKANDKSLAMTGSFTSMLLTILYAAHSDKEGFKIQLDKTIKQSEIILKNSKLFKNAASMNFERVVFLGSGPMLGIARECHLKLQELTDGQVICKHDSFLGFRHGPRAVTNENTLLVYLFSANDYVYQYELDLARSLSQDSRNIKCISIGRPIDNDLKPCLNIDLELQNDEELNIIPATLVGQLLGYYKALQLNLNPDNPSVSGAISRVVQGVKIYSNPNL